MPYVITLCKSISTVGAKGHANGPHRVVWRASPSTGDAATANPSPFTPKTLLLSVPCSDRFFPPNSNYSGNLSGLFLQVLSLLKPSLAVGRTWPNLGFSAGSCYLWVGVLPGPATGSPFWHRQGPRWHGRWCQRVEMPLVGHIYI